MQEKLENIYSYSLGSGQKETKMIVWSHLEQLLLHYKPGLNRAYSNMFWAGLC